MRKKPDSIENNFAKNILDNQKDFNNFSVENFKKIFNVIEKIVNA